MSNDLAYRDLGESYGDTAPTSPPTKYYPSTSLCLDDFPELKDLGVSDTVEITFKCKVRTKMESESDSSVSLDLLAAAISNVSKTPALSKSAAIEVKNDADLALEAISSLKRKL